MEKIGSGTMIQLDKLCVQKASSNVRVLECLALIGFMENLDWDKAVKPRDSRMLNQHRKQSIPFDKFRITLPIFNFEPYSGVTSERSQHFNKSRYF